jgi:hypothetical protein
MSAADDYDIKRIHGSDDLSCCVFFVKVIRERQKIVSRETSLADAEISKDAIEDVFHIHTPAETAQRMGCYTQILGAQLKLVYVTLEKAMQGIPARFQLNALAGSRDHSRFARIHARSSTRRQFID